jgi:hypothetical protein
MQQTYRRIGVKMSKIVAFTSLTLDGVIAALGPRSRDVLGFYFDPGTGRVDVDAGGHG